MPFNYQGVPGNITTPISQGITSCASGAGGVIVVGTSGAHNFATGDYVYITGVGGTSEANNQTSGSFGQQITFVDSTHFSINGSTWLHNYTSGGTAYDCSVTPSFTLPLDGEPATAASIEVAIEAIADRTEWMMHYLAPVTYRQALVTKAVFGQASAYGTLWMEYEGSTYGGIIPGTTSAGMAIPVTSKPALGTLMGYRLNVIGDITNGGTGVWTQVPNSAYQLAYQLYWTDTGGLIHTDTLHQYGALVSLGTWNGVSKLSLVLSTPLAMTGVQDMWLYLGPPATTSGMGGTGGPNSNSAMGFGVLGFELDFIP